MLEIKLQIGGMVTLDNKKHITGKIAIKNPIQWMFVIVTCMLGTGFIAIVHTDSLVPIKSFIYYLFLFIIFFPILLNILVFLYLLIFKPKQASLYVLWEYLVWANAGWIIYLLGVEILYVELKTDYMFYSMLISFIVFILFYLYEVFILWPRRFQKWNVKEYLIKKSILDNDHYLFDVSSGWEKELILKNRKNEHWWDKNTFMLAAIIITLVNIINILKLQESIGMNKGIFAGMCALFLTALACEAVSAKWSKYKFVRNWEKENNNLLKIK